MAGDAPQDAAATAAADKRPKATKPAKREVRILMLHGYTQSGPLFRAKTRAVEKLVAKTLAPAGLVPVLSYPTAPIRLSPRDIPGWESATTNPDAAGEGAEEDEGPDAWAWFRKDEALNTYRGLDLGMQTIASAIAEATTNSPPPGSSSSDPDFAPLDGVLGFSQGAAMAALLAAAMEQHPPRDVPKGPDFAWVHALRAANRNHPLSFAVCYCGFWGTPKELRWLYEPKIATPTLHVLGSLDTVVEEGRSQGLLERCKEPVVVYHPGGHYVPVGREWVMRLVGFVKGVMDRHKEEA